MEDSGTQLPVNRTTTHSKAFLTSLAYTQLSDTIMPKIELKIEEKTLEDILLPKEVLETKKEALADCANAGYCKK